MEEHKPLWVHILLETIGIPTIVAICLGVPAMIASIVAVWGGLDFGHKVWLITALVVLCVAIALFIYGRTRRVLNLVPTFLQKTHDITRRLAGRLNIDGLTLEDYKSFFSLAGISHEIKDITSSVTDVPSLVASSDIVINAANSGTEQMKKDKDAAWRLHNFMFEKVGLKGALEHDGNYRRLKQHLDTLPIPNPEIMQGIFDCEYLSRIACAWIPILKAVGNEKYREVIPLPHKVGAPLAIDEMENQFKLRLSTLRQSIQSYYAGGWRSKGV